MRNPAKSFTDLVVWQKAHEFVLQLYRFTEGFPRAEIFALTAQMRRAAVSIPANIAEGFGKRTTAEKIRFLNIAQASLEESKYYLILSRDLQYGEVEELQLISEAVGKLLAAYQRAILRAASPKRKAKRLKKPTTRSRF
ncbi:MAG TPA: four helix bundle protein [Chthoniobacterales bacterium]|nr:four helix bundle protein [Chthoniobacterales bacterium]